MRLSGRQDMRRVVVVVILLATSASERPGPAGAAPSGPANMERVRVSANGKGFVLAKSRTPFVPWGFNYDHDDRGRLIEDYWEKQWPSLEKHFGQMKALGANVVRIHLQLGKFMDAADKPNEKSLKMLARLLELAEKERLYLDLTGLGFRFSTKLSTRSSSPRSRLQRSS